MFLPRRYATLADEVAAENRRQPLGAWAKFALEVLGIGVVVGLLVLISRQIALSDFARALSIFWLLAFGWAHQRIKLH